MPNSEKYSKQNEAKVQQANAVILKRTLYAAGAGLVPVPIVDAAALLGVQMYMARDIADIYEVEFSEQRVKSLISALVGDIAAVSIFKIFPFLNAILGGVSGAVMGASVTYALGKVFLKHFEEGGTFLNFDPVKSEQFFKDNIKEGKRFVKNLRRKNKSSQKYDLENEDTSIDEVKLIEASTNDIKDENNGHSSSEDHLKSKIASLYEDIEGEPSNLIVDNENISFKVASTLEDIEAQQKEEHQTIAQEENISPSKETQIVEAKEENEKGVESSTQKTNSNKPSKSKGRLNDLKVIKGIGPKTSSVLSNAGINTIEDLANSSLEELKTILEQAGERFNLVSPNTWIAQAQKLINNNNAAEK